MTAKFVTNMAKNCLESGNLSPCTSNLIQVEDADDEPKVDDYTTNNVANSTNSSEVYNMNWCIDSSVSNHMTLEEAFSQRVNHIKVLLL